MTLLKPWGLAVAIVAGTFAAQSCTDGGGECAAVPTCSATEVEVESCVGVDGCHAVTLCGQTIDCAPNPSCTGSPSCLPSEIEVATCPAAGTCTERTLCGETILCAPAGAGGCDGGDCPPAGGCLDNDDCDNGQFCNFADGLCGAGLPGECAGVTPLCDASPSACYCDGTVSVAGNDACEGLDGSDFDWSGGCTVPEGGLVCGPFICTYGTDDFCRTTDVGPANLGGTSCGFSPPSCGGGTVTCACLTSQTADCGGSCTDAADGSGPTIVCPVG